MHVCAQGYQNILHQALTRKGPKNFYHCCSKQPSHQIHTLCSTKSLGPCLTKSHRFRAGSLIWKVSYLTGRARLTRQATMQLSPRILCVQCFGGSPAYCRTCSVPGGSDWSRYICMQIVSYSAGKKKDHHAVTRRQQV